MPSSETTHRKYQKDFLDSVIVRIDFDTPLSITNTGPSEKIYAAVKGRFPITEEKNIIGKELLITPSATKERSIEKKEWHYYGINREKQLTVSPDYMFVKYDKYEYYEKLHDDFTSVCDALFTAYPKSQVKRLGLRYINNIDINEGNPTDWSLYLIPNLLSIFNIADDRNSISRAFHVLEFNYGEDDSLRFQFGMFNADYPAPIRRKVFTLDFDMYATRLLDNAEIKLTLNRFHNKINRSFEEVITDNLRKIMEPSNG